MVNYVTKINKKWWAMSRQNYESFKNKSIEISKKPTRVNNVYGGRMKTTKKSKTKKQLEEKII